jgi:hypothetical protein
MTTGGWPSVLKPPHMKAELVRLCRHAKAVMRPYTVLTLCLGDLEVKSRASCPESYLMLVFGIA